MEVSRQRTLRAPAAPSRSERHARGSLVPFGPRCDSGPRHEGATVGRGAGWVGGVV